MHRVAVLFLLLCACDATRAVDYRPPETRTQQALNGPDLPFAAGQPCTPTENPSADLVDFRIAVLDGRERLLPALTSLPTRIRLDLDLDALDCAVLTNDAQQADGALQRAEAALDTPPQKEIGDAVDVASIELLLQRGRDFFPDTRTH